MPDKHLRYDDTKHQVAWINNKCLDADAFFRERFVYKMTVIGTTGLPNDSRYGGYSCGYEGVIVTFPSKLENEGYVIQMFFETNGQVWSRYGTNLLAQGNPSDKRWFGWRKVGPFQFSEIAKDLQQFVKRPESHKGTNNTYLEDGVLKDCRLIEQSGMFKTKQTTLGLPAELNGDSNGNDKWGVLLHFWENEGTKAGFQLYKPIDGTGKAKLYMRAFKTSSEFNSQTPEWYGLNIPLLSQYTGQGGGAVPAGNYWELPTETIDSVTGQLDTGYYKTTETTTGMEGVPSGRKDGILKVIKDDNLSIQEYSPSKEGDNGYFLRTISVTAPISRQSSPFEEMTNESTHLLIHDTRLPNTLKPSEYKSHAKSGKGFAVYEWKFTNKLIPVPVGESGERCILLTLEPDPKASETGGDYTDITQIAYVIDGSTWIRHGASNGDSWKAWRKIGGEGGSSTQIDFQAELLKAFQEWEKQGTKDRADEAEFIKWAEATRTVRYKEWTQQDTHKPDQEAFKQLIAKLAPAGGGPDFREWAKKYDPLIQ